MRLGCLVLLRTSQHLHVRAVQTAVAPNAFVMRWAVIAAPEIVCATLAVANQPPAAPQQHAVRSNHSDCFGRLPQTATCHQSSARVPARSPGSLLGFSVALFSRNFTSCVMDTYCDWFGCATGRSANVATVLNRRRTPPSGKHGQNSPPLTELWSGFPMEQTASLVRVAKTSCRPAVVLINRYERNNLAQAVSN